MVPATLSLEHAISGYCRLAQSRREEDTTIHRYSIALSRQAGSLGTEIARALAERLHWSLYDSEIVSAVANNLKVRAEVLEQFDAQSVPWFGEVLAAMDGAPNQSAFAVHLRKVVAALGWEGHAVFLGRGASALLPRERCFKARIVGSRAARAERYARRHGLAAKEASANMERIDLGREQFIRDYYRTDPADPTGYDVVLNTDHLSVDACVGAIVSLMESRWPGVQLRD